MCALAVRTFDYAQVLGGLHHFPTRMTLLPLAEGSSVLISPIPLDAALLAELEAQTKVAYLVAPNLLHHFYLAAARERFPAARVLAPPGLRVKRPDLRIDVTLDEALPADFAAAIEVLRIDGAPQADEYVFLHRASSTLVVTDLVFNVVHPKGWFAHALMLMVGCHGHLAQSRVWRFLVKDKVAAARSIERLLALPFETLIMAHGEIVHENARSRLAEALHWLARPRPALPAAT